MNQIQEFAQTITQNVQRVIVGKTDRIELILVAMLCEGHILIDDVPGVGKTILSRAVAISLGCTFRRLQCTPDLLPNDVTGVSVFNQKTASFDFLPGPVFSHILLADEINRATPRTQSALLECMGERQVTVDGVTRTLPRPFLVMATQNPVEFQGTFPLPEAQLDRFLLALRLGYPSPDEEDRILLNLQRQHPIDSIEPVCDGSQLPDLTALVVETHVDETVRDYIIRLTGATRQHPSLLLGVSPRGTLALFKASQALAALRGRDYVLPDDVKYLARPTLAHRLILHPDAALRGARSDQIIGDLLASVSLDLEGSPPPEAAPQ